MSQSDLPFSNLSNRDLSNELGNAQHNFPLHVVDNLTYDPFKYFDDLSNIPSTDCGIYKPKCDYCFCGDTETIASKPPSSLSLTAFNICSIPQHIDSFIDQCVNSTNLEHDILGFCETRLNDTICNLYSINGYEKYFTNRNTHGGGVAIYVKKHFQARIINETSMILPHIESLVLEITAPQKYIVTMIYRPPNSDIDNFLISLHNILNNLLKFKMPTYIMGDFNINLLSYNDNNAQNLVNMFHSYSFFSTINKPTRVTKTSASIIDHLWTNNFENYETSGIVYVSISDHFPIFSRFSLNEHMTNSNTVKIIRRKYNGENINCFRGDLEDFSWNVFTPTHTANALFDKYINKFIDLYNKHFPLYSVCVNEKHLNKPYLTPAIKQSIKQRHKLQKLSAKWPLTYETTFKTYRNKLNSIIRTAKENYYKDKLIENAGDQTKTWDTLNILLGKDKAKLPTSFIFNDKITTDSYEVATQFNEYFSNIGTSLASDIQDAQQPFHHYLPEPVPFSFYLRPTSLTEVLTVIRDAKVSSPGHDEISIKIIKDCCDIIAPFLVCIINKSFQEGSFPDHLKIARIVPVYKKGDNSLPQNYRPISILSCFSKVFEKIMSIRLLDYLSKQNILTSAQYGFRPKYSTDLAVHHLCQNIYNALDNKMFQVTVFCDFTKAFDTISHDILLHKLSTYGIRGNALNWFKSYLTHRKQYTAYNNTLSSQNTTSCGVPQGSILGPILFLLYINDITLVTDKLKFLLYADDTTIFIQGHNLLDITTTLNTELNKISNWIKSNKLTLNINKTQYMVSSPLMTQSINILVKIDNVELIEVSEFKFLGVILDNKLRWKAHIDTVKSKVALLTGIIYRLRSLLTVNCLKQIYYTLIYPHLLYCSALWGGAYKTYVDSLFVTQKKLLRIMFYKGRFEHTHNIFVESMLLKLHDVIHLQTNLFVHKFVHSLNLDHGFTKINHNLTRRQHLRTPLCRTSHAQQSVLSRGTIAWNNLPLDFINEPNIKVFKSKVKKLILEGYNEVQ